MLGGNPLPSFLDDGKLDTFTLGKRYPRFCSLADGKHIAQTSCKFVPSSILDMDSLKTSLVLISALDHSNTPSIPSTCHHDYIPNIKFDELNNLVFLQVQLDGVISLDERVWVADSAPVIGVQVWDALLPKLHWPNLAKLELPSYKENKWT